jgi:hypothetical protein
MMLEEKELCKTGELAIAVMRETASLIIGDLYKVRFALSRQVRCIHNVLIFPSCTKAVKNLDLSLNWEGKLLRHHSPFHESPLGSGFS